MKVVVIENTALPPIDIVVIHKSYKVGQVSNIDD